MKRSELERDSVDERAERLQTDNKHESGRNVTPITMLTPTKRDVSREIKWI